MKKIVRAHLWIVAVSFAVALMVSPAVLQGQLGPSPDGTRGLTVTDAALHVYTFGTDPGPYGGPFGFPVLRDGQSLNALGVEFLYLRGGVFFRNKADYWYAIDAGGHVSESAVGDPFAEPAPPPPGLSGPVSGPPVAVPMFPLPDPLPRAPLVSNTNPKLLRVSDITPAIDVATGEPWFADVTLQPENGVYDNLGYGLSFKVRRVDGDLRVVYAVGGDYNHPTTAREFSLAGLTHGRLNYVRFTNAWGDAFSGTTFSPGEHLGLWVDPKNQNHILSCGSMDYTAAQTATVFERTIGPNGAVAGLVSASFGRLNKDEQGRPTSIDGLNGKECFGGFANTPRWMRQAFGMGPLMIFGGQYTSLVAQAASASMGLFGATFNAITPNLSPGAFVPTKVFADHRNGSRVDDWANPLDSLGNPKKTSTPGTQPFDRGKNIAGFIQNWLDGNVGVANASRSTQWSVDCDGPVCTVTAGPRSEPLDQAKPNMEMFAWWTQGIEIWQRGSRKIFYPQSYLEIGGPGGVKHPVKFLGAIDENRFRIDQTFGKLKDAYFIGPNVEDFYRQVGFDDRNQWNGVFPDGAGRWSWGTGYLQTPTLIGDDDGQGKYGLVAIYNGALGQVFYDHSTFQSDSRVFEWHIFDPNDFGKVALGQMAPHMVQPAEMVFDQLLTDDSRRFGRTQGVLSWGQWESLAVDAETGDLYVFGPLMAHSITGGQLRIRKYHCPACASSR